MNDIRAEIKRMLLELLNKEDLDEKQGVAVSWSGFSQCD